MTFEEHDKLKLKPFAERLERYLMVEHEFVEGSLVVSLNARFGAGKTTFLQMWRNDMKARRKAKAEVPMPILLNAWESDFCGDPLMAIMSALIEAVERWDGDAAKEEQNALQEAAKDVGWFTLGLANGFLAHWLGCDAVAAGELAESKREGRKPEPPDFLDLYRQRTGALSRLKEQLESVFGNQGLPKAIVCVDELDRCRPDYAISYLETIKHVFDVPGLVFILAIDYDHLRASAEALYGSGLKFEEYFRKFSHRNIELPAWDKDASLSLVDSYVEKYLSVKGKRMSMFSLEPHWRKQINELTVRLNLVPRQVQELFRILGHTLATKNSEKQGRIFWCLAVSTILLAAIQVGDRKMFKKLGQGDVTDKEFGEYLKQLLGPRSAKWWFSVYIVGALRRNGEGNGELEILFRDLGFVEGGDFNASQLLGQFAEGWGWGDYEGRFWRIVEQIESVIAFDS